MLNQIGTAVAASNFRAAFEVADAEIAQGRVHPTLFNARALWLERQQRFEDALGEFQRARAISPRDVMILNAVGLCLTRLYRLSEAVATFDEAIRINPGYRPTYHRKGIALGMTGDLDGAQRVHERALALFPGNTEALACLASVLARKGEYDKARTRAERALSLDPRQPTAIAALAMADNADGNFAAAEKRVGLLLDNPEVSGRGRASALGILGDALDGQNRAAEAFAAYTAENLALLGFHSARFKGRIRVRDFAADLTRHFETISAGEWPVVSPDEPPDGAPAQHVFLLGFFRSGTTLLEQVLESHPDVVTLEERDLLAHPAERYLTTSDGRAELAELSGDSLDAARAEYWRLVRACGLEVSGKVMVDKNPLNTLKLPLIARLFPGAKVIFAIRDPRDVVLSCFRRHFEVNAAMYELLTLEGAAGTYDSVMRLGELMREKLPLAFHLHRYEHLVANFAECVGEVCRFVGASFRSEMLDFAETARGQDIRSPSAQQVRRGLYRDGVAQWRRYAVELAPVHPLLAPWVERFRYPAE
ncbi:MAG TPA: sulfotransferase [Rhizomicrobium sp.]